MSLFLSNTFYLDMLGFDSFNSHSVLKITILKLNKTEVIQQLSAGFISLIKHIDTASLFTRDLGVEVSATDFKLKFTMKEDTKLIIVNMVPGGYEYYMIFLSQDI